MVGDLFDSPWKILIVAVVIIVLFGSRKLPDAARSLDAPHCDACCGIPFDEDQSLSGRSFSELAITVIMPRILLVTQRGGRFRPGDPHHLQQNGQTRHQQH